MNERVRRRPRMPTHKHNNDRRSLSQMGGVHINYDARTCCLTLSIAHLAEIPALAEDAANGLPGVLRQLLMDMLEYVREIDRKIGVMEAQIRQWHRHNEASQRLADIPGRPVDGNRAGGPYRHPSAGF